MTDQLSSRASAGLALLVLGLCAVVAPVVPGCGRASRDAGASGTPPTS